jgi:hypothetical protein
LEPYEYYTLSTFSDYVNREYITYSYWFMTTASLFSFLGLPFGMVITIIVNFYMDYCLIYHFVLSMFAIGGWYDDE